MNALLVALGGAVGAVGRYGISKIPVSQSFPWATFLTNLLGAFIIGLIVGIAERRQISDKWVLFLKTGFCGGFTTFSTFSLESVTLLENGKYGLGITYMLLSLICCVAGVMLGQLCARAAA